MAQPLPPRPHLDHLRRQAKTLLADLAAGSSDAMAVFRQFLPAARGLDDRALFEAGFRLADAQAAIARQSGFGSWPRLARHVEQLRALEGTWTFSRLEVDGDAVPAAALRSSRILIDGDRFRTESPEATYEGTFIIDVEAEPHRIDIDFVAGPEAGRANHGIFRLDGEQLEICLDVNGGPAPGAFRTARGSGHAWETLRRASAGRPDGVHGGTAPPPTAAKPAPPDATAFAYVPCETLRKLEGQWSAEQVVLNGQELPAMMRKVGRRTATGNAVTIAFGGRVVLDVLVRVDESASPVAIDYLHRSGELAGSTQLGIFEWRGEVAWFCMAPPGQPRPAEFSSGPGSGRTLSGWRRG